MFHVELPNLIRKEFMGIFKQKGKEDDPVDDWSESPLDKLPKPVKK